MLKQKQPLPRLERTTLTVVELAEYLGVSKDLVYKLVREKRLPVIRLGTRLLFKRDTIDRFIGELEQQSIGKYDN